MAASFSLLTFSFVSLRYMVIDLQFRSEYQEIKKYKLYIKTMRMLTWLLTAYLVTYSALFVGSYGSPLRYQWRGCLV